MTFTVLRRISSLTPLSVTTSEAPVHGPATDVTADARQLVPEPRRGDSGRDCCDRPRPTLIDGQMHCASCRQPLVAAWHGEDNKLHSSVAGANEPLEFP